MFLRLFTICFLFALSTLGIQAADSDMRFIENKGQWDNHIVFNARLNFGNIYFEKNQFTFILQEYEQHSHEDEATNHLEEGYHYKIQFVNANSNPRFTYSGRSEHYYNFFLGNNKSKWQTNVREYESISYRNLYKGINMSVTGVGENMKYEYYVAPGHAPSQIKWRYPGIDELAIKDGNLVYTTSVCQITEEAPYAFQMIDGKEVAVACNYKLSKKDNSVSFEFPDSYNKKYELVIDPTLVFARLSGSSSDNFGFTATYDADGRAYAGGIVFGVSGQYTTTVGSFNTSYNGGNSNAGGGGATDIGVSCYNATTGALVYGTYIGGSSNELPNSMIVNNVGDLLILATTGSNNFPMGPTPYDNSFEGGSVIDLPNNGVYFPNGSDIAVVKLSNNGSTLLASTFVGGTGNDGLNDDENIQQTYDGTDLHFNYGDAFRGEIIVDLADNVYVASSTNSNDFPTTGTISNLQGFQDAIVFKLNPNLTNLLFSRYLGGTEDDAGYSMKIDDNGNLFVDGGTKSTDFPTTAGALNTGFQGGDCDGYIAKLNSINGSLQAATYMGTGSYDQVYFVDLDDNNDVYCVGQTLGSYPVQNAAFSTFNGNQFIHKLDNNLSSTIYSTVFGTGATPIDISPTALLVDNCQRVYVSGWGGTTNQNRNINQSNPSISGMPITADAIQSNTSGGGDVYFFVLDKNATGQLYGSYFGGTAAEHVDGGTSRFDERGIIYQAICAACAGGSFPSSSGFSSSSGSNNCNVGVVKMDIGLPITSVDLDAFPTATGCVPLTVNFESILEDVTDFLWEFGDGDSSTLPNPVHTYTDTGVFIVKLVGTDFNSCNEKDSAFLTVTVSNDTIVAKVIDTLYVDCDSLDVFVGAPFEATTTYNWDMGDGTLLNNAGNFVTHRYALAGAYDIRLYVVDTTKCDGQAWDTISLEFAPKIQAEIGTENGCINTVLTMQNFSNPDSETFIWDLGNGETSNLFEPTTTYTTGGTFTVILTVIDSATCNFISSDTSFVNIIPPPMANFETDSNYYLYPELVDFTNLSINFTEHEWIFGDGARDTSNIDVSHLYLDVGDFSPCLKVENEGCRDSTCLDLFIDFIPLIGVPNAFSPNGDNVNDVIRVEGVGIVNLSFRIYNRWGELVYEGFDQNEGWDGNYKSVAQELEVYTYVVNAIFIDESQQVLKGNITIVR